MEQVEIEKELDADNLRCKECSLFPDITIYNYKNRVKKEEYYKNELN